MLSCKYMPHRDPVVVSHEKTADRTKIYTVRHSAEEDIDGILEIIPLRDTIIRVRYTESEFVDTESASMLEIQPDTEWSIEETPGAISVRTPRLLVSISKGSAALTWQDAAGNVITEEPADRGKWIQPVEVERTEWSGQVTVEEEQTVDGIKQRVKGEGKKVFDRNAWSSTLRFRLFPGESIYGLGQHEKGTFDYSRSSEFLYQANMKVSIPTFLSSRGYAIHQDQHCFSHVEGDGSTFTFWSEVVPQLDYTFVYGPEFDDLVGGLRLLTGHPPMLPRWAYGFVQSKERYETAQELIDVVRRYRKECVPLDCIVLDWSSWEEGKWGEKLLDPKRFPDPKAMMEELHELGARLMISIWPHMKAGGGNHREMEQAGFLMANGTTYDSTRSGARELYWKQAREGLFDHGIDAWWCDCTEPFESDWFGSARLPDWHRAVSTTGEFKKFMDPGQINAFSLHHSRGLYEGQRKYDPSKRVVNLTRSSGPSQQRYGTITWSGDVEARWSRLRKQLADGLNFVMTGNPRWTFDIGGFFVKPGIQWFWDGQYPEGSGDLGYRELYTRWYQTGCFLPMFRSHGTDTAREIWNFGKPGTPFHDTIKAFTELRYRLLPYIYSVAAWEVYRGYTLFRSLLFDFRADDNTHRISDQFMFGPALMVCPVLEPMRFGPHSQPLESARETRPVYLPAGRQWFDFWTGEKFEGGQWIEAAAPLEKLPLFVPSGSIIPMGPVVQHSGEQLAAPWEVHVFPGNDARFDVYEDAGDGYACEEGEHAWTPLHWDEKAGQLSRGKIEGNYPGFNRGRMLETRIH